MHTAAANSLLKRKATETSTDRTMSKQRRKLPTVGMMPQATSASVEKTLAASIDSKKTETPEPSAPATNRPRKYRPRASFDQRLQDLQAYKAQHGNCWVPYAYAPNPSLGEWVADMRGRQLKLKKDQRQALDQVGFQ